MTTNLQLAGMVAQRVQINAVNLVSASLTSAVDPVEPPTNISLSQAHRATYVRENDAVVVNIEFRLTGLETDEEKQIIELECTFRLLYDLTEESDHLPEESFAQFAKLNGPYNAWPYWRELVQTVAGRVGLGAMVIPVFRPVREDVKLPSEGMEAPAEDESRTKEAGTSERSASLKGRTSTKPAAKKPKPKTTASAKRKSPKEPKGQASKP